MPERHAFLCLVLGGDEEATIHVRAWEIPAGPEAVEKVAEVLTEAHGNPAEWITDDGPDGRLRLLFYGGGS